MLQSARIKNNSQQHSENEHVSMCRAHLFLSHLFQMVGDTEKWARTRAREIINDLMQKKQAGHQGVNERRAEGDRHIIITLSSAHLNDDVIKRKIICARSRILWSAFPYVGRKVLLITGDFLSLYCRVRRYHYICIAAHALSLLIRWAPASFCDALDLFRLPEMKTHPPPRFNFYNFSQAIPTRDCEEIVCIKTPANVQTLCCKADHFYGHIINLIFN